MQEEFHFDDATSKRHALRSLLSKLAGMTWDNSIMGRITQERNAKARRLRAAREKKNQTRT